MTSWLDERLQTMELLGDSLTRRPEDVPSPAWHGEVLAERMAKLKRGEGEFLTLAEVEHETRVVAVLDLRRHPTWIRKQVSRRR